MSNTGNYSVPGLSVEVTELAIFRLDLRRVELGVMREYVLPPLLLFELLQVNEYGLLVLYRTR